jgi:ribosome-associated heat shock protein Hsp15
LIVFHADSIEKQCRKRMSQNRKTSILRGEGRMAEWLKAPDRKSIPLPRTRAPSVRLDKWLWAVRVFKTRSLASAACRHGHVTISGQKAKPSREVRVGDLLILLKDNLTRTFKVLQLLDHRVGAPVAREFVEDQTPASELEKARQPAFRPVDLRLKASGRPTKKERRILDRWKEP